GDEPDLHQDPPRRHREFRRAPAEVGGDAGCNAGQGRGKPENPYRLRRELVPLDDERRDAGDAGREEDRPGEHDRVEARPEDHALPGGEVAIDVMHQPADATGVCVVVRGATRKRSTRRAAPSPSVMLSASPVPSGTPPGTS